MIFGSILGCCGSGRRDNLAVAERRRARSVEMVNHHFRGLLGIGFGLECGAH